MNELNGRWTTFGNCFVCYTSDLDAVSEYSGRDHARLFFTGRIIFLIFRFFLIPRYLLSRTNGPAPCAFGEAFDAAAEISAELATI